MSIQRGEKLGKRKQQALETRRRILESALTLFKDKGFDAVAIEDIAALAGTSKGSFYTYFQTKSDIIIEEFRRIDDYYEQIYPDIVTKRKASARLKFFLDHQVAYVGERLGYKTLAVLYMNQISYFNDKKILTNRERPLVRIVTEIIRSGQENGEFDDLTPAEELANWVNRSMRGLYLDWAISKDSINVSKEGSRYISHFILPALLNR